MSDQELDFDPDELAMLRQLFRSEAEESLEQVTIRVLAAGSAKPSAEALTEMMRVTHTLKGAAGTVGLGAIVDLSHRLESALAALGRDATPWTATTADQIVEITDGLRGYFAVAGEPAADTLADQIRVQIDQIARPDRRPNSLPPPFVEPPPEPILEPAPHDTPVPEPKAMLRVEPDRIDALMSSAGELLFDRTRIERRVQLLRTLARDLARTRQTLHDSLGDAGVPGRATLVATESELAGQAALLSQTTAALLDEIEALRRTIGELQRGLTRIRMESAKSLMTHAARTLRALRRATGVVVELRTLGEDTEFDKAVAEQLFDPITQLLRNAVAHGVESADERIALGKPANATITIRARQDGNLLVLEITDDGRGIDTATVRDRLIASGQWSQARAQLADDGEILDALLGSGVSVKDDTDELAGRGIGIGLVRQTVSRLGGEVKVSSTPHRGTTFSLRLPLSTALAQAMLFKVGGQVYAIPNVHVVDTTLVDAHVSVTT
ncbi:MAG: Hpt domain-containing protein, partial [Deltaproteobacteria bacterium]|nr:Hpt domain-containing protein [Deltaproteobacteria bacterium]